MTDKFWIPVAITTAIQILASAAVLVVPTMAPAVAGALGISASYIGLYIGILYTGAIIASLSAGNVVARFGAIRTSQVGLMLCAAGLLISTYPALPALTLGALLIGLGLGPITPSSSFLLARSTPAHQISLVFSLKQTGVPLGGVLAGVAVPALLLWGGWQSATLAFGAATLLCAALAQTLRTTLDTGLQARGGRWLTLGNLTQPLRLVMSHPPARLLAVCAFVFSICQLSFTVYLVIYFQDVLSYGAVAAGLALSLLQISGVAGRILWGYMADRWLGAKGTLLVLAVGMSVSSFAMAALDADMPPAIVFLVLVISGLSAIGWNGVFLAEVARQAPPGQTAAATGGSVALMFFGVVVGPPVFGLLVGLFDSYRAGFVALGLATSLCIVALARRPAAQRRSP